LAFLGSNRVLGRKEMVLQGGLIQVRKKRPTKSGFKGAIQIPRL
jgi:hypothetical protein